MGAKGLVAPSGTHGLEPSPCCSINVHQDVEWLPSCEDGVPAVECFEMEKGEVSSSLPLFTCCSLFLSLVLSNMHSFFLSPLGRVLARSLAVVRPLQFTSMVHFLMLQWNLEIDTQLEYMESRIAIELLESRVCSDVPLQKSSC